MSRYRKIEVRTWSDEKFRSLSPIPPSGQGLWFFLLTGPHTTAIPGLFRAGRAAMAEELGWDQEAFDEAFLEVSAKDMVKADFRAKLVWLPKAIQHNKPESPNVVRGWRVELDLLPECDLKREAIAGIREALEAAGASYVEAFDELQNGKAKESAKALPKASEKPSANQEQEQEQEKEPNGSVGRADALPRCDTQTIVDLYHEILPELPRVRLMNDSRRKAITSIWKFALTTKRSDGSRRATNAAEALEWIGDYLRLVRENDFLMGRGYKAPGHEGWQCDLDFLLTERGKKHVIEKTQVPA